MATNCARKCKIVWFLHSLAQLSDCKRRCTCHQSTPMFIFRVIPKLTISTVRLLFVGTVGGERARTTPYPCRIMLVDVIFSLAHELNSLLPILSDRGQQCSIPTGPTSRTPMRSLYCFRRCFWYSFNGARHPGPCPTRFMINRRRMRSQHF